MRRSEITVRKVLMLLLVGVCLGIVLKTVGSVCQGHSIAGTIAESIRVLENHDAQAGQYVESSSKAIQKLQEKGIFCPEKKKPSPQVTGILGDSVLMNGKWCKVGEEHAGFKVLTIETTEVTLLVDGKEMKLAPLLARRPETTEKTPEKTPVADNQTAGSVVKNETDGSAEEPPAARPVQDDPLAWIEIEMSGGVRDFLLQIFEIMPADRLEEAKQEWAGLSEEQKKARLNEVQQLVDSGQADTVIEQLKASQI